MKNLSVLFILVFFASCSNSKTIDSSSSNQPHYSFDNIFNNSDTLFIKSQFADCGEWGGHEELIKIYRSDKKIQLTYLKYEANCGTRDQSGSIAQVEKLKKNITLSSFQKLALMSYMECFMKLQFLDKEISHSGNYFSLEDANGNLKISSDGNTPLFLEKYNDLMFKLEFPKVIIKDN